MNLRALALGGLALLGLNTLLTLAVPGPAPWPQPTLRLSPELCALALLAGALAVWRGPLSQRVVRVLAVLTTAAVLVHGIETASRALFGRSLNLYWDGRHVGGLLTLAGTPLDRVAVAVLVAVAAVLLLYAAVRTSWSMLARALVARRAAGWLAGGAAAMLVAFALHDTGGLDTRQAFSPAATPVVLRQARLAVGQLRADTAASRLPPSPAFTSDLGALGGADVLVLFAESYGVSTLDDPRQAAVLAAPRAALAAALAQRGLGVVSARVRSPTFGGGSWLAHGALLAGIDTQNPLDYDVLLTTARPTLVRHFAGHGYRTIGWMPGLQRPWPEGRFFGFDRIADVHTLGYHGPDFGPWRVPDQAAMALLHAQELAPAAATRPPRFMVFPTVSSHAPFRPIAPFVADWERLSGAAPYTDREHAQALDEPVSWREAVPAYVQSVASTWHWLGDYLARRAPEGLVTIVIGDHQPWAAVSGPDAPWDVPVHVITADAALRARFEAAGFRPGLSPTAPALGAMHTLMPTLLRIFDSAGR